MVARATRVPLNWAAPQPAASTLPLAQVLRVHMGFQAGVQAANRREGREGQEGWGACWLPNPPPFSPRLPLPFPDPSRNRCGLFPPTGEHRVLEGIQRAKKLRAMQGRFQSDTVFRKRAPQESQGGPIPAALLPDGRLVSTQLLEPSVQLLDLVRRDWERERRNRKLVTDRWTLGPADAILPSSPSHCEPERWTRKPRALRPTVDAIPSAPLSPTTVPGPGGRTQASPTPSSRSPLQWFGTRPGCVRRGEGCVGNGWGPGREREGPSAPTLGLWPWSCGHFHSRWVSSWGMLLSGFHVCGLL